MTERRNSPSADAAAGIVALVGLAIMIIFILMASGCSSAKVLGGKIINDPSSPTLIIFYQTWGSDPSAAPVGVERYSVERGSETGPDVDADGFCIPAAYSALVTVGPFGSEELRPGGYCQKINDLQTAKIKLLTTDN